MSLNFLALAGSLLASVGYCADPAQGWLGYAMGVNPAKTGIITFIEAYWVVPDNPTVDGAFFSPWFGIESSDNLNLIQPVNPWVSLASNHWEIYNEYYQWDPTYNYDSKASDVSAGDVIYGSVTYNGDSAQSYTMYHKDITTGWSVSSTIDVQKQSNGQLPKPTNSNHNHKKQYKQYTIAYFVFEKEARCDQYPPNDEVTFYNISIFYNNNKVSPQWTTAYVDDVCNNRAQVVDEATIKITWENKDHRKKKLIISLNFLPKYFSKLFNFVLVKKNYFLAYDDYFVCIRK
ncbi:hypothetical protein RFI_14603 [Reticulomyxa filosa]|uniref:Uncharacterized protein n=1 Tax=Reticulomyxa filosa TaxID=46433 RepID=X6NA07_RETFI|nr:hypothetical protein RFI_14603 [Reticulomyxa filosa]|eukprot:ETO22589.1 hypothetical protein RFI_14603 [Reticulomyxa filosa]